MSTRVPHPTIPPLTPTPFGVAVFCASASQQQTLLAMLEGAGYDAWELEVQASTRARVQRIMADDDYTA